MKIRDMLKATGFKSQSLITVEADEFISAAIQKLIQHDKGALPVTDEKNELIGIITERDIVRKCLARGENFDDKKVGDIMTHEVAIASMEDDLDYAINTMRHKKIRHIPIADGKRVVGMISMRDILGFQYEETKAEIKYIKLMPQRPVFK